MKVLLNNLKDLLKNKKINAKQALYLVFLREEISIHISSNDLRGLVKNKYIVGNSVAFTLLVDKKEFDIKTLSGTLEPKYNLEFSNEVVKSLCSLFCVYNEENEIVFPGDSYTTPESIASQFLQDEQILVYYFLIFLFMFPVKGNVANKRWEKHFTKTRYTGALLRVKSKQLGSLFIKASKKYDMGTILLATYLFISDSIVEGKPFIKKPIKFLKEDFTDYVEGAKNIISALKDTEDVRNLFIKKENTNDSTYTVL